MLNSRGLVPSRSLLLVPVRIAATLMAMQALAACGPSGGDSADYTITFAVSDFLGSDEFDLAKLSFHVDYEGGDFVGNGSAVSCELVASDDGETATFVDNDNGRLSVDIDASENPIVAGDDIVTCVFHGSRQPTSEDFAITVTGAINENDDALPVGEVDIVITQIDIEAPALRSGPGE